MHTTSDSFAPHQAFHKPISCHRSSPHMRWTRSWSRVARPVHVTTEWGHNVKFGGNCHQKIMAKFPDTQIFSKCIPLGSPPPPLLVTLSPLSPPFLIREIDGQQQKYAYLGGLRVTNPTIRSTRLLDCRVVHSSVCSGQLKGPVCFSFKTP